VTVLVHISSSFGANNSEALFQDKAIYYVMNLGISLIPNGEYFSLWTYVLARCF
jgi:hypothetical protein